jgi:hypothetical protein
MLPTGRTRAIGALHVVLAEETTLLLRLLALDLLVAEQRLALDRGIVWRRRRQRRRRDGADRQTYRGTPGGADAPGLARRSRPGVALGLGDPLALRTIASSVGRGTDIS